MIVIYGNEACVYCRKAKRLAEQYELRYEWKDTDSDFILNELKTMLPNVKTIPQIWWNGNHIGGYEDFATAVNNTIGGYGEGKA
jgi:glutaredoxin